MVLIFLLGGQLSNDHLIFAVLLGRIVTVGGDVMLYLVAMISNLSDFGSRTSIE
jgi:hypothetical protein